MLGVKDIVMNEIFIFADISFELCFSLVFIVRSYLRGLGGGSLVRWMFLRFVYRGVA